MKMMGDTASSHKLGDLVAEAWPAATAVTRLGKERRWRKTGAVLVAAGLVTLPFLVFFTSGQESLSRAWESAAAKLTMMAGAGSLEASDARTTTGGGATKVGADELLGGLLVRGGFDRGSCLSRFESAQYYKHSPYAPSPYLLRKLRAYEARHKRCGPGTPLYAKSVEQIRSGGGGGGGAECNYLVWLPYNGLGNRMLSLVSTFLYALLSDRVMLVHFPADFTDLFCEPFPDATWVLPPDFPVANLSDLGMNPEQSYRNLLASKKIANDPTVQSSVPPWVFLNLCHEQDIDKLFYCSDDQLALAKVSWLLLFSDMYFVPSLYSMGEFHGELHRLFPAMESVCHLLSRYLFHPTNSVWGLVARYYNSYLARADQRIGIQIRIFEYFARISADDMYSQILACSRQEHILPETEDDNLTTTEAAAAAGNTTSTAILIASLYPDYYEMLRSRYYEHPAKGGVRVSVFQPTHEKHTVPDPPCVRMVTMEPCSHRPASMECQAKAVAKEDLAQHVMACEDEGVGIKLFD
ncbi:Galactoside 2-alpha-L-fucosyltransferase [Zea mays]|uniref:Fucosyltransferase n=1 Tax=Zea mays TaxID=4577 RepID=A0A1D6NRZ0_MAIZE|nr:Galactoside 2-alpha-L-fucosyltransferase [Zea mays]